MKARMFSYGIACVAMIGLWFVLVQQPIERKQADLRHQMTSAQQQLTDFSQTMQELPKFLKASNDLEGFRKQLTSSLYAKSDILDLLKRISNEANHQNLVVTEISPPVMELLALNRATNNIDDPQFLNITVRLRGGYIDFGRFVSQLESAPYFRVVNSCRLESNRQYGQELTCAIGFKALIGSVKETA